jgi:ribokinase
MVKHLREIMTQPESGTLVPEVLALGDVNVDIIAHFAEYPAKGEDALANSSEIHFGGSAANTSVALSRMGVATRLITRVGCDPWAERAEHFLGCEGVDLAGLQRDPTVMTGLMYIIVTPDCERTILGFRGANVRTDPTQIDGAQFLGARHFHLSAYSLLAEPQRSAAMQALEMASRNGLTTSVDPGTTVPRAALDEVRILLPRIDILLPNLAEAQHLTECSAPEDCARALLGAGIKAVAVKLGRDGCLVGDNERLVRVPPFPVRARDSTGAGDSFAAGLILGYLGGLSWQSAGVLANALGARAASQVGGGAVGLHTREILALLQNQHRAPTHTSSAEAIRPAIGLLKSLIDRTDKEALS